MATFLTSSLAAFFGPSLVSQLVVSFLDHPHLSVLAIPLSLERHPILSLTRFSNTPNSGCTQSAFSSWSRGRKRNSKPYPNVESCWDSLSILPRLNLWSPTSWLFDSRASLLVVTWCIGEGLGESIWVGATSASLRRKLSPGLNSSLAPHLAQAEFHPGPLAEVQVLTDLLSFFFASNTCAGFRSIVACCFWDAPFLTEAITTKDAFSIDLTGSPTSD